MTRAVMSTLSLVLLLSRGLAVGSPSRSTAADNPIVLENQQPGTDQWQLRRSGYHTAGDVDKQIKGYASATSVNKGESITFYVTVNPAQLFTMDIYRIGWYQGKGARLMQRIGPLAAGPQPACPINSGTGLMECGWAPSYTFTVPTTWTDGIYLVLLTNSQTYQNYINFVIRDDSRAADLLYQESVTTYEAYNNYPNDGATGKSLYDDNSSGPNTLAGTPRAAKVSFDRPYADAGDGGFLNWEIYFVRWLERSGYDVTYSTDVDTHAHGERLLNHKAFLSVGHDAYWSKAMADSVEQARDLGVNLGFFGADAADWQVRFEPSTATADPNRVLVCYKSTALDPVQGPTTTVRRRNPYLGRPEQDLIGIQSTAWLNPDMTKTVPYVVTNSSHWVYGGTGFHEGDSVPNVAGYQTDRYMTEYLRPASINGSYALLSHSPVVDYSGVPDYSNSSIYRASSGAWVFAAGTISWSWALDKAGVVDARMQQTTANILNQFIGAGVSVPDAPGGPGAAALSTSQIKSTPDATTAPSGITLAQHTSWDAGATTAASLAFAASNTAGNWIAVVIRAGASGETFTVSDSNGNTYRQAIRLDVTVDTPAGDTLGIFFAENIRGGANTITVADTTEATLRFAILEYAGVATANSFDVAVAAQGTSAAPNSGSASTTTSGDLLLGAIVTANPASVSAGSGYILEERVPSASNTKLIAEDAIQLTAGTASANAVLGDAGAWGAALAAFRSGSGPVPDLTLTKTHAGRFMQGQSGATYTLTVSNGGGVQTTGPVTVTDTLPGGLTATALSGAGWSCTVATLTCTRGDALAAGASYPAITLTVNVASTAPASVTNMATVSGGGERDTANDTASDVTSISTSGSGLVAAYSFNEGTGTTVADASGTGNTGTIVNATWTTAGRYGNALVFNGTNAWVLINDSPSLGLTTAMTLEAWVNPSTVTSMWRDVIYKGNDNYFLEATSPNNATPGAGGTFATINAVMYGTAAPAANTWTHLAVTYDGATLRLYVNGTQVSAVGRTGNLLTSTSPLQIGGDSIFGQYFAGTIDEVRVYNVSLTPAQIQADMNAPIDQAPDVTLTKTHAGTFTPGQTGATYTLTVSNSGGLPTTALVTVTDTLPSGLTATAVNGVGWSCTLGTVTCTRSDALPAGASYPAITLTVNVASDAPASVTNSAIVSGGGERNTANNTSTDVTVIRNGTPGLVAAYSFNEGTGTTVSDASRTGNTGIIANATWTTAGRYGNALVFNGTNAWVLINDSASLHLTTRMTLEAWVNPFVIPPANCTPSPNCQWMDVVHKDSDRYYIEASSNVNQQPEAGGIFTDGKHIVFAPSPLPVHTWTHLALTFDGAMIRLYVNGLIVASAPVTASLTTSTNPLFIGADSTMCQYFNGIIDEVRVYNVALTAAQIQTDMNTPVGMAAAAQPPTRQLP